MYNRFIKFVLLLCDKFIWKSCLMYFKLLIFYFIDYRLGLMYSLVCFVLLVVLVDCVLYV